MMIDSVTAERMNIEMAFKNDSSKRCVETDNLKNQCPVCLGS